MADQVRRFRRKILRSVETKVEADLVVNCTVCFANGLYHQWWLVDFEPDADLLVHLTTDRGLCRFSELDLPAGREDAVHSIRPANQNVELVDHDRGGAKLERNAGTELLDIATRHDSVTGSCVPQPSRIRGRPRAALGRAPRRPGPRGDRAG